MHVGEEVFRVIRASQVEFESVIADVNALIADHEIDISAYPTLDRFFGALGYCAGDGTNQVVEDVEIEREESEANADD